MGCKKLTQLDVGALFHGVLFTYQKVLRDAMGLTASNVLAAMIPQLIDKVEETASLGLIEGDSLDEALDNFAKLTTRSELAKNVRFEKQGQQKYVLHVDRCVFAEHVHHMLNPKDVICPWAIIAVSIFQKIGNGKAKMNLSEFTANSSKTSIELIQEGMESCPAKKRQCT